MNEQNNKLKKINLIKENYNFRLLWSSRTISYLGDSIYNITLAWYIFSKTNSAFQVGLVFIAEFLPQLILGMFLGVLVDSRNKKKLMQISNIIQVLITLIFTILIITNKFVLFHIVIITIGLSLVNTLSGIAQSSILPELVTENDLTSANSLLNISKQMSNLAGVAIGGILVATLGEATSVFINSMTFLLALIIITFINYKISDNSFNNKNNKIQVLSDIKEGLVWLKGENILVVIMLIGTLSNVALGSSNILSVKLIINNFNGTSSMYSLFDLCIGIGLLIGGIFINRLNSKKVGKWFVIGLFFQCLGMLIISIAPYFPIACIGNLILGFGVTSSTIPMSTLFQVLIPSSLRGRINSISSICFNMSIPITYGFIGILGDIIGAKLCFGLSFLILFICIIIGFRNKALLRESIAN